MEICITRLLQILSSSSPFRRIEIKNFLRRPTMVAGPRIFFISAGLYSVYTLSKSAMKTAEQCMKSAIN